MASKRPKLERRDPIPPGVYYVDTMTPKQSQEFNIWIRQWGPRIKGLRSTETFRLFEVYNPVPRWPLAAGLGFPTVAQKGRKTSLDDTKRRGEREKGLFDSDDDGDFFGQYKAGFGTGVGALVLLYLLTRS